MAPATRKIEVADISITVREITVNEIRDWLINASEVKNDVVGDLILEDITIDELCRCSDLKPNQASQLTPTELNSIAEVCKELNASFFALRDQLRLDPEKASA
ncbi:MAG: hypothetical protein GQ532_14550 [Methylomarinum sp.]|nr:hypothetical protein [Methylomarinum sp.]